MTTLLPSSPLLSHNRSSSLLTPAQPSSLVSAINGIKTTADQLRKEPSLLQLTDRLYIGTIEIESKAQSSKSTCLQMEWGRAERETNPCTVVRVSHRLLALPYHCRDQKTTTSDGLGRWEMENAHSPILQLHSVWHLPIHTSLPVTHGCCSNHCYHWLTQRQSHVDWLLVRGQRVWTKSAAADSSSWYPACWRLYWHSQQTTSIRHNRRHNRRHDELFRAAVTTCYHHQLRRLYLPWS